LLPQRCRQLSKCISSLLRLLLLLQGAAELAAFDPFSAQPKMSYKDGYQKRYFVLDSFQVGTHSNFGQLVQLNQVSVQV
jgi:hypothetical protein